MNTLIPVDYWIGAFLVIAWLALLAYLLRPRLECKELREHVNYLEAELARIETEKIYYASKIAGLAPEAARLLDAVLNGEVVMYCRDGRPATIVGGEVVCIRGGSGA